MKKICLAIVILALAVSVFGQQALWTTELSGDAPRYVTLPNVTKEVLAIYDQYSYYYDFTGYDKDTFINTFGDDWEWVYDINSKVALALRVNIEGGSAVYVICVDRQGVNMLAFSNVRDTGSGVKPTVTASNRRTQFERWFKTILN